MKNEVILITGQRGQGKTTYIKNQIGIYSRVILFDLLGEFTYYDTAYQLREFFEKLSDVKDENFFVLNYFNPKTSEEDFHVICEAINRLNDIMFVVDEIDYFCSSRSIPKQFDEIVKRGRHQGLNLIVATRRPHEIPIIIRSQMTSLITFRQIERNDLQYLKEIIDLPEEDISGLEKFNFIKWTPEEGVTRGKVEKPKRSGKTQDDAVEECSST
jgi:AAA+ ATPase superfamily predicted ATPase